MRTRRRPELLAPAGDMEKLQMAVAYGADAVYLAGTSFGMRSFAGNFTPEELPKAVALAHEHGVRVHATVNTMPRNEEVAQLPAYLEQLQDTGVDALILPISVRSRWRENTRPAVSGTSRRSSRSRTMSARRAGLIWARSASCWRGS